MQNSLGSVIHEFAKTIDGHGSDLAWIAHQFLPNAKHDYNLNEVQKGLAFCYMNIFMFVRKGRLAYVIFLVDEALKG